jgi:hypothetical protein
MKMSKNSSARSAEPDTRPVAGVRSHDARLPAAASSFGLFLLAFGSTVDGPVPGSATAEEVREFVAADDVAIRVAATSGLLAVVALLVLVSSLATMARQVRPRSGLPDLILLAGLLVAVVQLMNTAASAMVRLLPGLLGSDLARTDDATVRGWWDLTGFTHFLGDLQMAPVAVLLLAVSAAGLLPRWLAWAGVVIGVSAALGTLGATTALEPLYPLWFAGLFGWWLWTLVVGVTLAIRYRGAARR